MLSDVTLGNENQEDEEEDELERLLHENNSRYAPTPTTRTNTSRTTPTNTNESDILQTTGLQQNLNRETLNALKGISNSMQSDSEVKAKLSEAILLMSKSQKRERSSETAEEEEPILLDGMFEIRDDSHSIIDMELRKKLKNPNDAPDVWWVASKMKETTKPVVGRGLYLAHMMPGRVNPSTLRKLHDRTELMTTKALASHNSGTTGDKTPKHVLRSDENDDVHLYSGRNFTSCKTVKEVVESVLNFAASVHQVRPYSYEALAILRGLHQINYFYTITENPKKQKDMLEQLLAEIFAYNQRRGSEGKFPATFKKVPHKFTPQAATGLDTSPCRNVTTN